MRFCIVTPCLNAEQHIERTMRSVIMQSALSTAGNTFLEYIISDGGSSDETVALARRLADEFSSGPESISVSVYTEPDSGMYDAVGKGFSHAGEADVYAYINAGDIYSLHAFEILEKVFMIEGIELVTGFDVIYNEHGHMVSCRLPYGYSRRLLDTGFYGGLLPHIQQESTFWAARLHQEIDLDKLRQFKLAGDAYLWSLFSQQSALYVVSAWLAGFTIHEGQLSQVRAQEYRAEHRSLCRRRNVADYIVAGWFFLLNYLPNVIKTTLSPRVIIYDHSLGKYRRANSRSIVQDAHV